MNFRNLKEGRRLASWVTELKGASGVYVVRERGLLGAVLYVGESHTGRLKKTLLRHFQHWKGKTAGPTFEAGAVEIAVFRTHKENALETQNALIAEYAPKLNTEGKPDLIARLTGL